MPEEPRDPREPPSLQGAVIAYSRAVSGRLANRGYGITELFAVPPSSGAATAHARPKDGSIAIRSARGTPNSGEFSRNVSVAKS